MKLSYLLLIATFGFSSSAYADDVRFEPVEDELMVGKIVFQNKIVKSTKQRRKNHLFQIPEGDILVVQVSTPNYSCNAGLCPDFIFIESLPIGIVADEIDLEVEENETGTITLYRELFG